MAAGVVAAGVIVYFTLNKKPKYDLTVEAGTGVTGTPAVGKYTYKKGKKIAYNFNCADGYENLAVLLDGETAAASGIFIMDRAHNLKAAATQMADYSLVVKTSDGITGSPAAGTFQYREGTAVQYHYAAEADYKDLAVLLDGKKVAASGAIIMDRAHTLEATAAKTDEYTLVVKTDAGITGSPAAGTYHYKKGTLVSYQYSTTKGIPFAKLDGNPVLASGSLKMNANHVLKVSQGESPDIRGKWRFLLKGEDQDLDILFSGEKTSGVVDLPADPTSYWHYYYGIPIGRIGTYGISISRVSIVLTEHDSPMCNICFYGYFTSTNTMIGTYEYCFSDPPIYYDGTWTATRI